MKIAIWLVFAISGVSGLYGLLAMTNGWPYLLPLSTFESILGETEAKSIYTMSVLFHGMHRIWPIAAVAIWFLSSLKIIFSRWKR